MKKILSMVFMLSLVTNIYAQRPPTFTQNFDKNINDIVINDISGVVIVQVGGAKIGAVKTGNEAGEIHGFSQKSRKIIWSFSPPVFNLKNELKGSLFKNGEKPIASETIVLIPGTPYFQKLYGNHLYVIDSNNGEIVFSTSGGEFYYQAEYLFDENAFLLRGVDNANFVAAKYSINKKEIEWKTVLFSLSEKSVASKLLLASSASDDRLEFTKDRVFVLLRNLFFALDKSDGTLVWKNDTGGVYDFYYSLDGSRMILISSGKKLFKESVDLYDVESGQKIWDKPLETKFVLLYEDWQDKMLLAHFRGFNFFDYGTGEKLWSKDPKGKNFKKVIPIGKDFLYAYDDELMLIDKDGQKRWKKDVKISDKFDEEIIYMGATNNNRVLYVTQSLANMVDYNTGKKIWKGNLKLNEKKISLVEFDENSGEFLLYNSGKLYRFTESTSSKPSPFKLQLKRSKLVTSMQLFEDGVTISGQIEVVKVANDGTIVFHNKYTQPGEAARGLLKGGAIALKAGGSVTSAKVTTTIVYRDSEGNEVERHKTTSPLFGKNTRQAGKAAFAGGNALQSVAGDRFNAMREDQNYAYIFAKGEAGEKFLVKVDKRTGEEVDKLIVENNRPLYDIDKSTQAVIYAKGKNLMIYE